MTGVLSTINLLNGPAQAIYVNDNNSPAVVNINICNRNSSTVAIVRIAVSSAQTPLTSEWIEYDVAIPAKSSLERTGVWVDSLQYIVVRSNAPNVNAVIYGITKGDSITAPSLAIPSLGTITWTTAASLGNTLLSSGFTTSLLAIDSNDGTVSYSLAVGSSLPTGLTLSTAGVIQGTPSVAGSYSFTITASNGVNSANRTFSLTVNALALFSFTTHTFTTGGTVGRYGPGLATLQSAYSSQTWASNPSYFFQGRAQGYQVFQIPETGTYEITVAGARGQDSSSPGTGRGRGAILRARVSLTSSDKLEMVVGQVPGNSGSSNPGNSFAGGGGGTFIAYYGTSTPIMVAGGGGGSYASYPTQSVVDGQTRRQPRFTGYSYSPAVDGTNPVLGQGGPGYHGGGGGGFLSGGQPYPGNGGSAGMTTDPSGQQTTHGASFVGSTIDNVAGTWYATGGNATTLTSEGGFGGGGGGHSGNNTGGGGGGYSGGLGGQTSLGGAIQTGTGGGSFIISTATNVATSDGLYDGVSTFNGNPITNLGSFNDAAGYIIITKV